MNGTCVDCLETRKLGFQIEGLDLVLQKQQVILEGVEQKQDNRDVEHDATINNVATRVTTMETKFTELQNNVNSRLDAIEKKIPELFTNAVNALLAKIAKWMLLSVAVLIVVSIVAWNRPGVTKFLEEMLNKAQTMEVIQ